MIPCEPTQGDWHPFPSVRVYCPCADTRREFLLVQMVFVGASLQGMSTPSSAQAAVRTGAGRIGCDMQLRHANASGAAAWPKPAPRCSSTTVPAATIRKRRDTERADAARTPELLLPRKPRSATKIPTRYKLSVCSAVIYQIMSYRMVFVRKWLMLLFRILPTLPLHAGAPAVLHAQLRQGCRARRTSSTARMPKFIVNSSADRAIYRPAQRTPDQ